jgi:hypothetical protein
VGHWDSGDYWPEDPTDPAFATNEIIVAIEAAIAEP